MLKKFKSLLYVIDSGDKDELLLELGVLKKMKFKDEHVLDIIRSVEAHNYLEAKSLILDYIHRHQLTKNNYQSITGLRTIKSLMETKFSVLTLKKLDVEKYLHDFRERNIEELGALIQGIMSFKIKLLELSADGNEDALNQAKFDKKIFEDTIEEQIKQPAIHLDKEEIKELRMLYRKASKYCHPDIVEAHLKEQAAAIFVELNMAYVYGNIARVRELTAFLESSNWLKSDMHMDEIGLIEQAINKLGFEIKKLEADIKEIKDTPEYKFVLDIKDWNTYFFRLKTKFEADLRQIENDYNQMLDKK